MITLIFLFASVIASSLVVMVTNKVIEFLRSFSKKQYLKAASFVATVIQFVAAVVSLLVVVTLVTTMITVPYLLVAIASLSTLAVSELVLRSLFNKQAF
ncbi:MAG: hypothetical protein ACRC9P_01665 [Bacteroides sp.]